MLARLASDPFLAGHDLTRPVHFHLLLFTRPDPARDIFKNLDPTRPDPTREIRKTLDPA